MADELPPAILDLVVETAGWMAGIASAIESLSTLDAAIQSTVIEVDNFGESLKIAADEAAAAMDEANASIIASSDAAAASLDELSLSADHAALAEKDAAASAEASSAKSAVSAGLLGGAFKSAGTMAVIALAAVGAAGVEQAANFQTATTRLVTSAGESASAIDGVRQGILTMSGQVGQSADALAQAMYYVESAGFHAADGLQVLQASAQGAKDEQANLSDVSNAVTTILKDYGLQAGDAANVTSQMVAAISYGKTNFQDFSRSMATVLPIASAVGLKFADVASVEADMTAHGTTAQRAAMDIANAIRSLIAPTKVMEKEFTALGINSDDVSRHLSQDGLAGTLQWLNQVATENAGKIGQTVPEAMKKLIGTAPGLQTMLETTGQDAGNLGQAIRDVGNSTADARGNVQGFAFVQQTLKQQLSQAKDAVDALMIRIGEFLLPVVQKGAQLFTAFATSVTSALGDIASKGDALSHAVNLKSLQDTFAILGKVITQDVIPAVKNLASTFGPVLGIAFATVVAAVKGAVTVLAGFMGAFKGITDFIEAHKTVFQAIAVGILAIKGAMMAWAIAQAALTLVLRVGAIAMAAFDAVMDANPIMLIVLAIVGLVAGFAYLWTHSAAFRNFWEGLWKGITAVVGAFVHWFEGALHVVVGFFERWGPLILAVIAPFIGIPLLIIQHWNQIVEFFRALPGHLLQAGMALVSFFKNLPYEIGYAIGFLAGLLVKIAYDAMTKFRDAVVQAAQATLDFFKELPHRILDLFADARSWLEAKGTEVITGLVNGIVRQANLVWNWVNALPGRLVNLLEGAQNWLQTRGREAVSGFIRGIGDAAVDLWNWFTSLHDRVRGLLGDAISWLVQAGRDVINGLIHGIESMGSVIGNAINNFASGVINGFKSAFGIGSPSKVMAQEVGVHLTAGIAQGMLNGMQHVHGAISQISNTVSNVGLYGAPGLQLPNSAALAQMAGGGGGGTGVLVINNNVSGTVVGETQLSQVVRTQVLRYNNRNPSNGLTLFGRGQP